MFCLQIGDTLYTDSKVLLGSKYVNEFLMPYELSKSVKINGQETIFVTDDVKATFGYLMKRVVIDSNNGMIRLEDGLEQVFAEFKYCIFITGDFSIAIMKSEIFFGYLILMREE